MIKYFKSKFLRSQKQILLLILPFLNNQKIDNLLNQKNFKFLGVSIDTIGNVNRDFKKKQWSELISKLNKFILLREQKGHLSFIDIKTVILEENIDPII